MDSPIDIFRFNEFFSDEGNCLNYIIETIGVACPYCKTEKPPYQLARSKEYRCSNNKCYKKYRLTTNTIFSNTKLPLSVWFNFIYGQCLNNKNRSSMQQCKELGITQKTMWNMAHSIRNILKQDDLIFSGTVEIDEAFLGKHKNVWSRWGSLSTRKEPILGMFNRESKSVIIKAIPDRKQSTVFSLIDKHISKGATIYSDGNRIYNSLSTNYTHESVIHSHREYVRGDIHTNNIENVWGQLKKNIRSIHHSISAKHVQIYCDELCFRVNNRHLPPEQKFRKIISKIKIDRELLTQNKAA